MAAEWLLEVHDLRKSFGESEALRGIELVLRAGESLALFGPNGAGKTTLLRILAGLVRPSGGVIRFAGSDLITWGAEARRHIGLVSHKTFLHQDLTAEENLRFCARLYGTPQAEVRIAEALRRVEMELHRHTLPRALSRGMQQRLSIARLLLYRPLLLLLDEPYTGLDPHASELLTAMLQSWRDEGRTIILASHDLQRGARACTRAAIMRAGRIVYDTPGEAWQGEAMYEQYIATARL